MFSVLTIDGFFFVSKVQENNESKGGMGWQKIFNLLPYCLYKWEKYEENLDCSAYIIILGVFKSWFGISLFFYKKHLVLSPFWSKVSNSAIQDYPSTVSASNPSCRSAAARESPHWHARLLLGAVEHRLLPSGDSLPALSSLLLSPCLSLALLPLVSHTAVTISAQREHWRNRKIRRASLMWSS